MADRVDARCRLRSRCQKVRSGGMDCSSSTSEHMVVGPCWLTCRRDGLQGFAEQGSQPINGMPSRPSWVSWPPTRACPVLCRHLAASGNCSGVSSQRSSGPTVVGRHGVVCLNPPCGAVYVMTRSAKCREIDRAPP